MDTTIIPAQFTGNKHCFQGIVKPLNIDEENNVLQVELSLDDRTWIEDWNLQHTIWGLENGEYVEVKEIDPYLKVLGDGRELVLPFINPYKSRYTDVYGNLTKKQMSERVVPVTPKNPIGRNNSCPCGSGLKYKKCCGK